MRQVLIALYIITNKNITVIMIIIIMSLTDICLVHRPEIKQVSVHYISDELWEGLNPQIGRGQGFVRTLSSFNLGHR